MDTLTRQPATSPLSAELTATPQAAGTARSYVAAVLTAWEIPDDLIDTARLLTSELAANAITHGTAAGGTFTLEVRSFGCCLGIEVHDSSPNAPVPRPPADDAEHGRGLLLVAELADSWGYYFENGCKHVWFHLHITSQLR
jgi:anti-sigma regulatory factor (Ser/Thr protein kinase)